jgi:hypothetical protein
MKSLKVDEKVGSGFATRKINMEKNGEKKLNETFHLEAEMKRKYCWGSETKRKN